MMIKTIPVGRTKHTAKQISVANVRKLVPVRIVNHFPIRTVLPKQRSNGLYVDSQNCVKVLRVSIPFRISQRL